VEDKLTAKDMDELFNEANRIKEEQKAGKTLCEVFASSSFDDKVKKIITERTEVYGDPELGFTNIGLHFTALISQHYGITLDHPIPNWLAALMLATFKGHRCARVFSEDNFIDWDAYRQFVYDQQKPKDM
jgi:hypothetical protein